MSLCDLVAADFGWLLASARQLCSGADAEDLAGEAVCRMLENQDKYDRSREFRPWAYTVLVNCFKTYAKRRSLISLSRIEDAPEPDSGLSSSSRLELDRIMSVITYLGQRSVNIEPLMLYAQGYSYEEIAEMQGIALGTVRSRIANGRKLLKKSLCL